MIALLQRLHICSLVQLQFLSALPTQPYLSSLFFFNDTATTEIYTLSLHDALPISAAARPDPGHCGTRWLLPSAALRSEEHTSELQSQSNLVCRLLLEKKKKKKKKQKRKSIEESPRKHPSREPHVEEQTL